MKPFKEVIDDIRKAVMASEVREDIAQMGEYVEQFANTAGENIQKAIDPTLSLSGKAADAKATGDAVGELKEEMEDFGYKNLPIIPNANHYVDVDIGLINALDPSMTYLIDLSDINVDIVVRINGYHNRLNVLYTFATIEECKTKANYGKGIYFSNSLNKITLPAKYNQNYKTVCICTSYNKPSNPVVTAKYNSLLNEKENNTLMPTDDVYDNYIISNSLKNGWLDETNPYVYNKNWMISDTFELNFDNIIIVKNPLNSEIAIQYLSCNKDGTLIKYLERKYILANEIFFDDSTIGGTYRFGIITRDGRVLSDEEISALSKCFFFCSKEKYEELFYDNQGIRHPNLISKINNDEKRISDLESRGIVCKNSDILPAIHACSRFGYNADAEMNSQKQYTLLISSDIHGDNVRLTNMVHFLNKIEDIDAGICLGDIQQNQFDDNDGTWYANAISESKKPFYTIIGNHDTKETIVDGKRNFKKIDHFNKFIKPTLNKIGLESLTKTYYHIQTIYGVDLICLDIYDIPDRYVDTGTPMLSPEQVNWLVETLKNIPKENDLLIALHATNDAYTKVLGNWTQLSDMDPDSVEDNRYLDLISDIINAWQTNITLTKTYMSSQIGLPTIYVNADFSDGERKGKFVGYLRGHSHTDTIAKIQKYPSQNIICLTTSALDGYQEKFSDLPRVPNEKSEDAITVLTVDRESSKIKLVRVGSNINFDMVRRDIIAIDY